MNNTKIPWADATFNPITGCYHTCPYCYARKIAHRFGVEYGGELIEPETYRVTGENGEVLFECLQQPYIVKDGKQRKIAYPYGFMPTMHRYKITEYQKKKKPLNIFVGSMSDIWGRWVPDRWIAEVFMACEKAPQHNYLFLTKNPARYLELAKYHELPDADNFWYGTTVTTPDGAFFYDKTRLHHTFLSIEPLMEDFESFGGENFPEWIIVGAETGNRRYKVVPERSWVEHIVDICRARKVPVFMKENIAEVWGDELIREYPAELRH